MKEKLNRLVSLGRLIEYWTSYGSAKDTTRYIEEVEGIKKELLTPTKVKP